MKTCKWYQTIRLIMTRRLVCTQDGLPKSNVQVDLSNTLCTMSFVMTSGDLNIDLTQKSYLQKL